MRAELARTEPDFRRMTAQLEAAAVSCAAAAEALARASDHARRSDAAAQGPIEALLIQALALRHAIEPEAHPW